MPIDNLAIGMTWPCSRDHDIGRQALADRALLADVLKHKKVFFDAGYANYDACHTGAMRLLPDQRLIDAVASDLRAMIDVGMFYGERPSFEKIVGRLRALEDEINTAARLREERA